jgi:hypothetical protein
MSYDGLTDDEFEEFEERASILEFDANFDKDKAEMMALEQVLRKRKESVNL